MYNDCLDSETVPKTPQHAVHHGYGFQLEWKRMRDGLAVIEEVHSRVRLAIMGFIEEIC